MSVLWQFSACCPFCPDGTLLIGSENNPASGMRSDAVAACPECAREFIIGLSLAPTGRKVADPPRLHPAIQAVLDVTERTYGRSVA